MNEAIDRKTMMPSQVDIDIPIRDYIREVRDQVKDLKDSMTEQNKILDARISAIEVNINFIKGIFSHWKLLAFIFIVVAFIDPHPILKFLKSIKDMF